MNELIKLFINWFQERERGNIVLFFLCVLVLSTILTLIWLQVFNHIPSQIKNTNTQIKVLQEDVKELRKDVAEIKETLSEIKGYLKGKEERDQNPKNSKDNPK